MENKERKEINKGVRTTIFDIITVILIVAKCFGLINLTWFQCFIPLIIGTVIGLVLLLISCVIIWRNRY